MRRINYIQHNVREEPPKESDITLFLHKRVIELETKLNDMKTTVETLRQELKEKTAFINLILENERRMNETKEMNAMLEEYAIERTKNYVDLQSQLISHLESLS